MTKAEITPFESDIAEQPAALKRLAANTMVGLDTLTTHPWPRIVLTGMGSSHYAGLPTWQHLISLGHNAWAVDTGRLLDNPSLLTPETLLIVTSQSGASGEVIELLRRRRAGQMTTATLVGIADDDESPLAQAANVFLPLHSGPEATVSTKSYLNTLAVHRLIRAAFSAEDLNQVRAIEVNDAANAVQAVIDEFNLAASATATAQHPSRRLAYVGAGESEGTALFSALITKESAKVAAEGYIGGQFRHGPFELAGDGLTVVIFAPERNSQDASLRLLAADLMDTGSHVIVIGDPDSKASVNISIGGTTDLAFTAASSVVAELFALHLARANGVVPGAFIYGRKITVTI